MNFLAHAYLSPTDAPEILAGNFFGDFFKGRIKESWPIGIQKGVQLHRNIDEYTDQHPLVFQTKARFFDEFHHFAGIISDVLYDHFLAVHWEEFHSQPLKPFTEALYQTLEKELPKVPERGQYMFSYMSQDNWLLHYAQLDGIAQALRGLSRRAKHEIHMQNSLHTIREQYSELENEFLEFWQDIRNYLQLD